MNEITQFYAVSLIFYALLPLVIGGLAYKYMAVIHLNDLVKDFTEQISNEYQTAYNALTDVERLEHELEIVKQTQISAEHRAQIIAQLIAEKAAKAAREKELSEAMCKNFDEYLAQPMPYIFEVDKSQPEAHQSAHQTA